MSENLLELRHVVKRFERKPDLALRITRLLGSTATPVVTHAVDDVSLTVRKGEVLGLVGESGCGKSTLARLAIGLHRLTSGSRWWKGADLDAHERAPRSGQLPGMQMVFQDPYASLNPRMRVRDIVGEAPLVHRLVSRADQQAMVADLLQRVGLDAAMASRYPHQFSGGQRARIGIARALAMRPELLICDEAVAALDVSIQAQVLDLFMDLRAQLGLTYLFISHDLSVVRHLSDRVAVMYLGRVIELAPVTQLFNGPAHPYTIMLLACAPRLDAKKTEFQAPAGELPSPQAPPSGCHFHPRCAHASERCRTEQPALTEISPGHWAACHLHG